MLTGCPGDDEYEGGGGDDEVGDGDGDHDDQDGKDDGEGTLDSSPKPVDPLAGGLNASCADQASHIGYSTPAPASLGNGLVHDARLSLSGQLHQSPWVASALAKGVQWSTFVGHYNSMAEFGFRPVQLRSGIIVTSGPGDSVTVGINDRSVYVSDDDANYKTEVETYVFADLGAEQSPALFEPEQLGARPTSIESFSLNGPSPDAQLGFSLAWVYDGSAIPWEIRIGLDRTEMIAAVEDFGDQGYRPISIASRQRNGVAEYSAIFVDDDMPAGFWDASLGLDQSELEGMIKTASNQKLYPARITAEHGSWSRLNVVWARLPAGLAVEVRMGLTMATFMIEDALRRSEGYHLESFDQYEVNGVERYVGVWLRYQPCWRWTGTAFDEGDPDYEARYKMFHEQAIATMDQAGTDKEGRLLRPSGTLHIFEGEELVLNRAYTFAPTIYPDTPLDTPMKLASVSKSLTAAAVVQVMNEHGLPLATPYVEAAGIVGAPVTMNDVTVLDALRNLGGFRAESTVWAKGVPTSQPGNPESYFDHAMIDASDYGVRAIDGREMLDYAALDGHLDTNDDDSYWDLGRYAQSQSQSAPRMHYSNPGYSILGELVSDLSGMPYEQYVIENLAEPLELQYRLYPDPGHRKDARGPTIASLRTYLISKDHPYRYDPPGITEPVDPIFGLGGFPAPHSTTAQLGLGSRWGENQGPVDPAAPRFASVRRYAGQVDMGGAPLAAGGWYADGAALGAITRALNQSALLMPNAVANQLWNPEWKNDANQRSPGWSYGLGLYVRGNWVAWAGGAEGSMATVMHNRTHDFTVVLLTNVLGNGLNEFAKPLMPVKDPVWGGSEIGKVFPCVDEPDTPADECEAASPFAPY